MVLVVEQTAGHQEGTFFWFTSVHLGVFLLEALTTHLTIYYLPQIFFSVDIHMYPFVTLMSVERIKWNARNCFRQGTGLVDLCGKDISVSDMSNVWEHIFFEK